LGFNRALVLPANPSLGRIIRDGEYFVRGKPIHRTEFAHDPEYPRKSAQVLRMVNAPQRFLLRLANGSFDVPDYTILIGQATSPYVVRAWVRARQATLLPRGSSEFFGALLAEELQQPAPPLEEEFEFGDERQLFVCGTASDAGNRLFRSARKAKVPVFTLPQ